MSASRQRAVLAAAVTSSVSTPLLAGDMPVMPGSYWSTVLLLLTGGLPFSLILYPALLLVPAFLIRTGFAGSRRQSLDQDAADRCRTRRWRVWTLASLVPWGLLGLWILYDLATNKSF